jgi:hypothetical protein
MPQRILGEARSLCLMARYHVNLLDEKAVEGVSIQSGHSRHMRMMPTASDKTPAVLATNHVDVTAMLLQPRRCHIDVVERAGAWAAFGTHEGREVGGAGDVNTARYGGQASITTGMIMGRRR